MQKGPTTKKEPYTLTGQGAVTQTDTYSSVLRLDFLSLIQESSLGFFCIVMFLMERCIP